MGGKLQHHCDKSHCSGKTGFPVLFIHVIFPWKSQSLLTPFFPYSGNFNLIYLFSFSFYEIKCTVLKICLFSCSAWQHCIICSYTHSHQHSFPYSAWQHCISFSYTHNTNTAFLAQPGNTVSSSVILTITNIAFLPSYNKIYHDMVM